MLQKMQLSLYKTLQIPSVIKVLSGLLIWLKNYKLDQKTAFCWNNMQESLCSWGIKMQMLKARGYWCHKKKLIISKVIIALQLWEISKHFTCFFLARENDLCTIPVTKTALKNPLFKPSENYFCPILKPNSSASTQRVHFTPDYETLRILPETWVGPSHETR